jgi:CoA:oxalate CoA-transferase
MADAFSGIRVIDFTSTIAGPHCARLLADLGADVIKIEPPEGDMMRSRPPLRDGASTLFGQLNAGKRSIVLDLKLPEAAAQARHLATGADVVVENFRPGVMARLGLDYATLAAFNPRLVYCAISGYGQTGPSAARPAYAPVIHAAAGYDLGHLAYQPGRTRPDNCGIYVCDVLAGTYAFGAIAAALHQRHASGRGQFIDLSLFEATLSLMLTEMQAAQFAVPPPPARPIYGPIESADGFVMVAMGSERIFQNMAAATGRGDWLVDPRFADYASRRAHWGEFIDEIETWSRRHSTAECIAALDEAGVPASPYRSVGEAMADPQLAHRGSFVEVADAAGTFKALNPPFRMSGSRTRVGARAAARGEHNASILHAAAGRSGR